MTDPIKRDDALKLARLFHENYEALAPRYGYKTRDEMKDFDPTTTLHGQLMIATCGAVLSAMPAVTVETCWKCDGSGMAIGDDGDPRICNECKYDGVVPVADSQPDDPVVNAPYMTDLMTDPESLDAFMETNPLPIDPAAIREAALQARIEELVKERDDLGRKLNTARYGQPDFAWSIHEEAMADLRAKLAKAVEALRGILKGDDVYPWRIAREILVELEGK